jgi:hypothetical protein
MDLAVPVAHHDDAFARNLHQEIVSAGRQVILMPDAYPSPGKNALLFLGKNQLRNQVFPGQSSGAIASGLFPMRGPSFRFHGSLYGCWDGPG